MKIPDIEEDMKEQGFNKELITRYAPVVLVVFVMFFQYNLFVTPQQLEAKHREILTEISEKYTTKEQTQDIKNQLTEMQKKIDKIYELVSRR